MEKITWEVLQSCEIDPHEAGLVRFIPETGVGVIEFIRLPIEGALDEYEEGPAARHLLSVLCQGFVLEDLQLLEVALCAARRALLIYEKGYPNDKRPRRLLEILEKNFRQGYARIEQYDGEARAAHERALSELETAKYRTRFEPELSAIAGIQNCGELDNLDWRAWETVINYISAGEEAAARKEKDRLKWTQYMQKKEVKKLWNELYEEVRNRLEERSF